MHLGFHIYDVGFQSPNVEAASGSSGCPCTTGDCGLECTDYRASSACCSCCALEGSPRPARRSRRCSPERPRDQGSRASASGSRAAPRCDASDRTAPRLQSAACRSSRSNGCAHSPGRRAPARKTNLRSQAGRRPWRLPAASDGCSGPVRRRTPSQASNAHRLCWRSWRTRRSSRRPPRLRSSSWFRCTASGRIRRTAARRSRWRSSNRRSSTPAACLK